MLAMAVGAGTLTVSTQSVLGAASNEAVSQIWSVARCLAASSPDELEKLLKREKWGVGQTRKLAQLSERNAKCGTIASNTLDEDREIARGLVAGAVYLTRHEAKPLPDYANAPSRMDLNRSFGPLDSRAYRNLRELMKATRALTDEPLFGECTVSKAPETVRSFLESTPFSKEETASLTALTPTLAACVPGENGRKTEYSRPQLRKIFGQAGLEMDYRASVGLEARH